MKSILRILSGLVIFFTIALSVSYLLSGGPSVILNHVRIQQPPEVVFDYISDMRNELKWNPDVQYMKKVTDDSVGQGTHFRAKWHMSDTIDVTVVRYERPNGLTLENGGPLEVRLAVNLTPVGSETELEARFIATPHGFLRAIFPIVRTQLDKQEKENMLNLKKALEK